MYTYICIYEYIHIHLYVYIHIHTYIGSFPLVLSPVSMMKMKKRHKFSKGIKTRNNDNV